MKTQKYLNEVEALLGRLESQQDTIDIIADKASEIIMNGNWIRMFGSGHSVLPMMDTFPRYGGYVGFYPIMDPRIMWTTASGPAGAEEVIWLERQEGYSDFLLRANRWNKEDMLIVISHGGQNAYPVEVAQAAKSDGLFVVALTSMKNHMNKPAIHSSGKKIGDIADIILDNCVDSEDAVVDVEGVAGKIAGTSTLSAIVLMQSISAQTAIKLSQKGYYVKPFATPNALNIEPGRQDAVYYEYRKAVLKSDVRTLE